MAADINSKVKSSLPKILMYPVMKGSGIGTYACRLKEALAGCVDIEYVEYCHHDHINQDGPDKIYRFKSIRLVAGYMKEFYCKYIMFREKRKEIDILHLNNMGAEVDAFAARCAGVKNIVGTLHVLPGTYKESSGIGYRILEWLSLKSASMLIAVSEAVADAWSKRTGISRRKIHVIYNGIDLNARDASHGKNLRTYKNKKFIIGVSDRLHPLKGHDSLIKAISILPDEVRSNTLLLIIGDGPQRRQIENLIRELKISESVELVGFVEDVYQYLKACNLYVSGSRYEGMPFSTVEAMGCGIPCVVTDVGGMSEIVRLSQGGKIVAVDDVKAMALAMQSYYENDDARNQDGERCKVFAEKELNSVLMAKATVRVYNQCLDDKSIDYENSNLSH